MLAKKRNRDLFIRVVAALDPGWLINLGMFVKQATQAIKRMLTADPVQQVMMEYHQYACQPH